MIIRCFVIDDMPAIIRLIKKFADATLMTTFVGGETDVIKALDQLLNGTIQADVVFLDIEMPGVSGLDLIEPLNKVAKVILISAHKDFGQQAFERGAIGYIYKPFDLEQFQKTILIAQEKLRPTIPTGTTGAAQFYYVPSEGRSVRTRLKADEIWFAESTRNFSTINMGDKDPVVSSLNLTQLDELLPSPYFIRISRSIIVNMAKVISYDALDVKLENGKEFSFGDLYKQKFINIIRENGMLY